MAARLDYRNFHEVFGHGEALPYDQHVNRDIESKRKTLGGVLFVDRVLTALGITKAKVYPPRDARGLHDLFQHILAAPMSTHHKLSALYYLLLDHDDARGPRAQAAARFAAQAGMPRRYQIFMTGLWHMDRLQFRVALEHLAHPSLLPEFADNIVTVLVRHALREGGAGAGAGAGDFGLALAYYDAVRPVLRTHAAVALLFEALARTDVAEALAFARAQPPPARQQLFEQLVASVLGGGSVPDASAGNGGSTHPPPPDTAARAAALVSLPLQPDEEAWLRAYLTTGAGRALKRAKDTLLMRQIVAGDVGLGQGLGLGLGGGGALPGGPWGVVLQGLRHGGGTAGTAGTGGGVAQ